MFCRQVLAWNEHTCLPVNTLPGMNTHVWPSRICLECTHMLDRKDLAWNGHACLIVKTLPGIYPHVWP